MNPSERLTYDLCRKSFLSLWTYPTPLAEPGKELCDILIVCDPDVIIVSVKEVEFKDTGRREIDTDRWRRKAIEESARQIYGAERWIASNDQVIQENGKPGHHFPPILGRKIHRVGVALGSHGNIPYTFGDYGKGFVHILTEQSLGILMAELDTISDFVKYLNDKESFFKTNATVLMATEEDLLALYLTNGKEFSSGPDFITLDEGLWEAFAAMPEVLEKREKDKVSYVWDSVIEHLCLTYRDENYKMHESISTDPMRKVEQAIRILAREPRFSRRQLGANLKDFLTKATTGPTRARIADTSVTPVRYVFLRGDYDGNRELNSAELEARCLIARGLDHSKRSVVGLLFEISAKQGGDATSLVYMDIPEWTSELQARMEFLQKELGYFRGQATHTKGSAEYPEI